MTPEEKAFAVVADDSWEDDSSGDNVRYTDYDKLRALIAQAIRETKIETKIEAYDEAAKIAEEEATGLKLDSMARYDEGYDTACLEIAAEIRALRDSLLETAPSN